MKNHVIWTRFLAVLVGSGVLLAHASTVPTGFEKASIDVVQADFPTLVNAAASDPTRFAVDIPHSADPQQTGTWSVENGQEVWRYAVSVPGAVSMSFHAINVKLPEGAQVTLTNGADSFPIGKPSMNRQGELWSRVTRGAVAYVMARMPQDQKGSFKFEIVSVQAGYKGFGGSGNAEAYDTYAARAASSSCQVNFSCVKNSSNALPSRAVVGLLFNNTSFCTGTLMNNVSGDYKPYVLTARHCGASSSVNWDASSVQVAWNAVADCGQPLQNVYSANTVVSSGATTRMLSGPTANGTGDAWLIELDSAPPIGSHPYWAGFDATGTAPSAGVYNINEGSILQQQYAEDTNPITKQGSYWSVLWTTSSTQPGASGSGLIDSETNHVIGMLNGGSVTDTCPGDANPPSSLFYRLDLAWVGDGTTAGSLKYWLDPASTSTKVLDGQIGPPSVEMTAPSTATAGQTFTVSWKSTDATSCSASGGITGDGWPTGSVATSGSFPISEEGGSPTYTVSCANAVGSKSTDISVSVEPASSGGGSGSTSGGTAAGSSGGGAWGLSLSLLFSLAAGLRRKFQGTFLTGDRA